MKIIRWICYAILAVSGILFFSNIEINPSYVFAGIVIYLAIKIDDLELEVRSHQNRISDLESKIY